MSDDSKPITGYILEERQDTKQLLKVTRHYLMDISINLQKLAISKEGKYSFRVAAVNECGQGLFSTVSEPLSTTDLFCK